jgi:uncharacterized protein (DUF58 family)
MKWFFLSLIVLLIAYVFDMGLLIYAMYAFIAILFISKFITSNWVDHVSATRHCDQLAIEEGETVSIVVEIKNEGRFPISWLLVEDLLPASARLKRSPSLTLTGRNVDVLKLGRGRSARFVYQIKANRRGYYQIGPLVLETGDLFGLHRRYRVASEPNFVLVYPKTITLAGYDISSRRPIGEVVMTHRLFEDPTRIAGVRQYESGDPLTRINWRATARTGELQSKIYEPSTVAGATILIDFDRRSFDAKHEPFRSELSVTAAASIANALYEMGQQVGFVSNGRDAADRVRREGWRGDARTRDEAQKRAKSQVRDEQVSAVIIPTRKSAEQMIHIRRGLARLELSNMISFTQLVVESQEDMPRDASIIAILAEIDLERAVALGTLRRQGYAVTAIINCFDEHNFARISGPLLAQGIETRHLRDADSVSTICRRLVLHF